MQVYIMTDQIYYKNKLNGHLVGPNTTNTHGKSSVVVAKEKILVVVPIKILFLNIKPHHFAS